jgi:LPS-assembly lipoprotein
MHLLTQRRAQIALTLLLLAGLSACGFKLRGEAQTRMPFKTIYLGFPQNSALGIELRRNIRGGSSTEIVDDAKLADAILDIVLPEKQEKIVLATNAGQAVEYRLNYRFAFRVRDNKGQELLPTTTFTLHRDVSFSASLALAAISQDQMLFKDMQSDLTQQILRRLSAIKPEPLPGAGPSAVPSP